MKKDKNFKLRAAVVSLATVGVLSLAVSLTKNGNFKLFAEPGEGYVCYLPDGETEIRDLMTDDMSSNGAIYKTRGTVTRIQKSEHDEYRLFIQRTNGEDGSKSSLMLTHYGEPFNVTQGNVIDVEGAYFYNLGVPEMRGYLDGNAYEATVAEESNVNPVEPWELSVDEFKSLMSELSYRDVSRLVTFRNIMFSSMVSGSVGAFDQYMYVNNAFFDAVHASGEGSEIETMSLMVSAYNTDNTNEITNNLMTHIDRNAVFDLTGVITYSIDTNEYALMLVDINDVSVVSEDGGGEDPESVIAELEQELGRPLTTIELEALPTIFSLMEYPEIESIDVLMQSDEVIAGLIGRPLEAEESAALIIFRELFTQVELKKVIRNLETGLGESLTEEEIDTLPVLFELMMGPGVEEQETLLLSDEEIEEHIKRQLTALESNAVAVFRDIMWRIEVHSTIGNLVDQLGRNLTALEADAVRVIIILMRNPAIESEDDLMQSDEEIEVLIGRPITIQESEALILFRAIIEEMRSSGEGGDLQVVIDELERQLGRNLYVEEVTAVPFIMALIDKLGNFEPEFLMQDNEIIEASLGGELSEDEINALELFRGIMLEIASRQ